MSAWTYRSSDGKADPKADPKIVPPRPRIPQWKGPSADSEEKREPVSDIDTAVVDSLKVLDLKRPIREADIWRCGERYLPSCPDQDAAHHLAAKIGVGLRRGLDVQPVTFNPVVPNLLGAIPRFVPSNVD